MSRSHNIISKLIIPVLFAFLFVSACDNSTEPDENPFVGTWNLSNLNQDISIKTAEDLTSTIGLPEGFVLVDTVITWQAFQAMGVQGTINLKADSTFTLSGSLPIPNDTLGVPPSIQNIPGDQGTWRVYAQADSFQLDGIFFERSGELTLNDPEDPTMITMNYANVVTDTLIFPQDGQFVPISIVDSTVTEIAFSKQ